MNRRTFLEKSGKGTLAVALSLSALTAFGKAQPSKARHKNWVWITPDLKAGTDEWKRRFEILKKAGFSAIIPEVYNGGPAYFGSTHLPVKAAYLEKLIPLARSFELEIHPWMWVMPCLLPEVQAKHPEWYMVNGRGESCLEKPAYVDYYKFLCPAREPVRDFIQNTVSELATYDVDGVHLDYVRYPDVIIAKGFWDKYNVVQDKEYPQYDYCYCETCRSKFQTQSGVDSREIKDPSMNGAWLQFRYDQVTELVNNRLIPAIHKNGKQASAAVFPNWQNVRQQWSNWRLDAVMPMLYNRFYLANADWIRHYTQAGKKSIKYKTKLYSGLMVDDPEVLAEYVRKAFAGHAEGISIFSLAGLTEAHFDSLSAVLNQQ